MPKTMTTISIDYSRYGHAKRVTVPLFKRERTLRVGDRVRVLGDDVPDRTAVVTSLVDHGRKAVLEFDDALAS
jgi:hypothetical protein